MQVESKIGIYVIGGLLAAAASFALAQLCTSSAYACHIEGKPDTVGCGGEPDQPPTVSLTKPVMEFSFQTFWNDTMALEASASDDSSVARVEFMIGGSVVGTDNTAPYEHSIDTTTLSDRETTVAVRAHDDGGQSTTSDPVTIQIDNTDPEITFIGGAVRTRGGESLGLVRMRDAGWLYGSVHCSFDGDPTGESCLGAGVRLEEENEYFLGRTDFADGWHYLTIRAADAAGNIGTTTHWFLFDRTPPETEITSGPAEGSTTVASSVSFGLTSEDASQVTAFECRLFPAALAGKSDEPQFEPCSGPGLSHERSGVAPGTYRFEARAYDEVGNREESPATRTFTLAGPAAPSGAADTGSPAAGSDSGLGTGGGGVGQPGVQPSSPPAAPVSDKPGKCAKLKGKKRAACVKKACGKLKGAKKKACVKKVTYKPQARRG